MRLRHSYSRNTRARSTASDVIRSNPSLNMSDLVSASDINLATKGITFTSKWDRYEKKKYISSFE